MAFSAAGTITLDMTSEAWVSFPPLSLPQGKTPIISIETVPINTTLKLGHFILLPRVTVGTTTYERPAITKFYPRGVPLLFKFPTFEKTGNPQSWVLGVIPVETFKGRANPKRVTLALKIDTSIDEGFIGIV